MSSLKIYVATMLYCVFNFIKLIGVMQLLQHSEHCYFSIPVCGNVSEKITVVQDSGGSAHG